MARDGFFPATWLLNNVLRLTVSSLGDMMPSTTGEPAIVLVDITLNEGASPATRRHEA